MFCLLQGISFLYAQDNYTGNRLNLRNEYIKFMQEEGFSPKLDSNGHLEFKKEGNLYTLIIIEKPSGFYMALQRTGFNITDDIDLVKCLCACNAVNRDYEVGKAYVSSAADYIYLQTELYVKQSDEFKYIFYNLMGTLDKMHDKLPTEYANAPSCQ